MKIDWKHIDIKDLAAIVTETLGQQGIDALLVGGACISIYTVNKYISGDLDFISHASLKEISRALQEIGFHRKSSRHFVRVDCPFFVEFLSPPAALGSEPIHSRHEMSTRYGKIVLLNPTDAVKDRLAAYYYWNDQQSLEQALMVVETQSIDLNEVKRWSLQEGFSRQHNIFLSRLRSRRKE